MKKFSLAGIAERVNCPFLVVHGEHDRIIPREEAQTLYDALGSKNKALKIFDGRRRRRRALPSR